MFPIWNLSGMYSYYKSRFKNRIEKVKNMEAKNSAVFRVLNHKSYIFYLGDRRSGRDIFEIDAASLMKMRSLFRGRRICQLVGILFGFSFSLSVGASILQLRLDIEIHLCRCSVGSTSGRREFGDGLRNLAKTQDLVLGR